MDHDTTSIIQVSSDIIIFHIIHPKLTFIALDYMTLSFIKILHSITQNYKYLVDMGDLKYVNLPKKIREAKY